MSHQQELIHPELADVRIDEDSEDLSRSEVILKGALAAGAVYGAVMVGPFVKKALAMSEGGDVGILNFALTLEYLEAAFYEEAKKRAERERRTEEPGRPDRRGRAAARRSADGDGQAARRQAGRRAEVRLPLQRHGGLPEAGADLRGHRGQRLQRRGARRSSRRTCSARPARSSRSRPGTRRRSASRTAGAVAGGLRPLARRSTGAEGCGTVHRVKPERLADEELMPLIAATRTPTPSRSSTTATAAPRTRSPTGSSASGPPPKTSSRRPSSRSGAAAPATTGRAAASAPGCSGIVRNRAIDLLRSRTGRAPLDFDDDSVLEQRGAGERTEDEALQRETARRGPRRDRRAARRPVEGDRARLLRRLQPLGDRRDAGRAAGHRQGPDAARVGEDAGRAGGGTGMSERGSRRAGRTRSPPTLLGALEPERGGRAGAPPRRAAPNAAPSCAGCGPRSTCCPRRSSGSSPRASCARSDRRAGARGGRRRGRRPRRRSPPAAAGRSGLAPGRRARRRRADRWPRSPATRSAAATPAAAARRPVGGRQGARR